MVRPVGHRASLAASRPLVLPGPCAQRRPLCVGLLIPPCFPQGCPGRTSLSRSQGAVHTSPHSLCCPPAPTAMSAPVREGRSLLHLWGRHSGIFRYCYSDTEGSYSRTNAWPWETGDRPLKLTGKRNGSHDSPVENTPARCWGKHMSSFWMKTLNSVKKVSVGHGCFLFSIK